MSPLDVSFRVNGRAARIAVEPWTPLLEALRELGLWSVKRGCETGDCGVCAVLVDGVPRNTCILPAVQIEARTLTTVEALGRRGELHPLQEAFLQRGAIQCGFCTPAILLCAKALLDRTPRPAEPEVRRALGSVLCRCTGYVKPVQAVLEAAERLSRPAARPKSGGSSRSRRRR
jgi:aerobic-type carbon monoxide dehydrogenase small subunit (CoxS/CutS family)